MVHYTGIVYGGMNEGILIFYLQLIKNINNNTYSNTV